MTAAKWVCGLAALSVGLLGPGCNRGGNAGQAPSSPVAVVRAEDGYWVVHDTPVPFTLQFGTERLPVTCTVHKTPSSEGDRYQICVRAHGQELTEEYASDRETVSLVGTGLDRFEPPIPLLEYGRPIGDEWRWSGINITEGEPTLPASASVRTSETMLRLRSGSVQSIKVSVMIYLGGRRKPADEMQFWFAPRIGLVRADLAGYSRVMDAPSDD